MKIDGRELYRVQTRRPIIHEDRSRSHLRVGPTLMGDGWYLAEDVATIDQIERWISLDSLEEVK